MLLYRRKMKCNEKIYTYTKLNNVNSLLFKFQSKKSEKIKDKGNNNNNKSVVFRYRD